MEKVLTDATLVFPMRGSEVLLARKARHIGRGCWNGYGGGIEPGESAKGAVLRELYQESGMDGAIAALTKVAIIDFHNTKSDGEQFTCRVHSYLLWEWRGEPRETEEMLMPRWHPLSCLPFGQMMPADPFWVPLALLGTRFYAEAWYGPGQEALLRPVQISPWRDL